MIKFLSISQNTGSKILQKLEENCELRGTDNVQGQISEHIFTPNGGYCVYHPSNLFRNARSFEFQLGNIRSRDVFRPIAYERKYLMDYNFSFTRSCRVACSLHLRGK